MILDTKERIEKYERMGVWGRGTFLDLLDEAVKECPDREAFVDPPNRNELTSHNPERITYRELKDIVNSVAAGLIEAGVEKDDVVVVQLPNTWELPMLYYAICKAGGIISPIAVQWRRKELDYVLGLTGAKVFITIEEFNKYPHLKIAKEAESVVESLKRVITLEEIRAMAAKQVEDTFKRPEVVPEDVWIIQWSSGTEAEPKACPRTHNSWYDCLEAKKLFKMEDGWRQFVPAPIVNNTGIGYSVVLPVITKGTCIIHHPIDFGVWIKQVEEEKPYLGGLVPAMMNMLLKMPDSEKLKLDVFKCVGTGSAAPSIWALEEFKRRYDIDVINVWGQNEGPGIHSGPLTTPLEKRVQFPQFGKKGVDWGIDSLYIKAIETKIVEPDTGKELNKVGEIGELLWRGPDVIPCYYNQSEFTEKTFEDDGYIHTGDLFVIEENNFISFFERIKNIIVRGGQNISAQEVENIVLKHPSVRDAAAAPIPDPVLGERTCIYVVAEDDISLDDIKTLFKEEGVAIYKWPEKLEIVEEIPRNPLGKIVKRELKKKG
jgi:acyl-CoA synthetase (AMP-forming)/AMP-acid ligase II